MRFFIAVLFILFSICCTAQKQASIWYFGQYAGLDFRSGTPVALNNSAMWTNVASAVISDEEGNLLFYTDGVTVWNRNNQQMPNGHNLWGDQGSQTLIVPQPGNDSLYYIFTASKVNDYVFDPGSDSVGFYYSVVNIDKANGLGDVVQKNILLFKNTTEKMTAVFHANGKDVWLVGHEWNNNSFRSYLITESGIDTTKVVISKTGVIHSGGFSNFPNANASGQMKLSPNGKKIALAIYLMGIQVFDFDNVTGEVSNPTSLIKEDNSPCESFGYIEFSPNSNLLFYTTGDGTCTASFYLKLYNVQKKTAPVTIAVQYNSYLLGPLQLALDGKIYVAKIGNNILGVIQKPNEENNVDFSLNAIPLVPPTNTTGGLPNFIQSYFLFDDPAVTMPNVFTPNGDSLNPRFVPISFENIGSASLTIINRWGEQVFYSENPQAGWDGGNFSTGTYYWFLSYYGKNGKQGSQKGWVQLMR